MVHETKESEALVLTSDTVRVIARWLLGISIALVPFIYSSQEQLRWWWSGAVTVFSFFSVVLFTKHIKIEGSYLEVRTFLKRIHVHLDQVLTINWEKPSFGDGGVHADIYLEKSVGFGNPVTFVGRNVQILERCAERLNAHHQEKARRARVA